MSVEVPGLSGPRGTLGKSSRGTRKTFDQTNSDLNAVALRHSSRPVWNIQRHSTMDGMLPKRLCNQAAIFELMLIARASRSLSISRMSCLKLFVASMFTDWK